MIRLRDVSPEDLPAVHAMNQAARPAVSDVTLDEVRHFAEEAVYFRVAVDGDAMAGFLIGLGPGLAYESVNYRWFTSRFGSFVYVDRVVIADGFRRRGIGGRFYDDVAAFARNGGLPRILCEVNTRPRNESSLRFHQKAGFREIGSQDTEGGTKTVVMLVRDLDPD